MLIVNDALCTLLFHSLKLHENTNHCMLCQMVCAQLAEEKSKPSTATSSDKENKDDSFKIKKNGTKKLPIKEIKYSKIEDHCSPKLDLDTPVDCFSTPNVVKRIKRCTSTPSAVTPHQQHPNDDMSPITQSAQKMTKSMQVHKKFLYAQIPLYAFFN